VPRHCRPQGLARGSVPNGRNRKGLSTVAGCAGGLARSVCPASCGGLAGESPAGVAAKRPRSWWPAEGETRPLKRHDKVALGGEQVIGPYDEESCIRVVKVPCMQGEERESSPDYEGEDHGRCEELGSAAPKNPSAYWDRNDHTAHRGTGEIRLGTGITAAGCHPAVPGNGKAYKRSTREVVERRAEVGGGVVALIGADNITRRSEGPPAGCATATAKIIVSRSLAVRWGQSST
jgi:hypothetical protein